MSPNFSQGQESAVVSQREWLALQNFGWKRLRGKEYMDDLSHLWYYHIVRSASYSSDAHLSALFSEFSKTYTSYLRLKVKSRRGFWNFLWSLIVSGLLIFVGAVCLSLADYIVPASFGASIISSLPFDLPLPGADILKYVGIGVFAIGALLFLLYTLIRTLIVIPVRKRSKKNATIEIMLEARKYISGKRKKGRRSDRYERRR